MTVIPPLRIPPPGSTLQLVQMRLRIPELLAERDWTPYRLSVESGSRISMSTAYRLDEKGGRLDTFAAELLEALCDVFGIGPGELFERDANAKPARTRRGRTT